MKQKRYPDTSDWDKIISPITLKMQNGTWELFKNITPRNIKLNDAILQLIHNKIGEESEAVSLEEVEKWYKDQEYWAEKKEKKKSKSKK